MWKYVRSHIPLAVLYFGVVFGFDFFSGGWLEGSSFWVRELLMFVGVVVGVLLLFLDRVVYTYSYPDEQLSQHFVYMWKKGRRMDALASLYSRRSEQQRLTMRSALFMVVWVPLAFFVITSTASYFGKGLVMGIMAHSLYDAWRLQRMDPVKLRTRLFWQIRRDVSLDEQVWFLWVMSLLFLLFTILV